MSARRQSGGGAGRPLTVAVAVSLLILLLSVFTDALLGPEGGLHRAEAFLLQDPSHPVVARTVIIGYDERSTNELGRLGEWSRTLHADMIDLLTRAGALAIGYDTVFNSPSSSPDADAALIRAAQASGRVVFAGYGVTTGRQSAGSALRLTGDLSQPLPDLRSVGTGLINVVMDGDRVIRRMPLSFEHAEQQLLTLSAEMARRVGADLQEVPADKSNRYPIRFFGRSGTFQNYSFSAVLSGEVDAATFKDKVVFIGPTAAMYQDDVQTPLGLMQGVELHANAFATLVTGEVARTAGLLPLSAVTLLLSLLTALTSARLAPFGGFAALLVIGVLWFGFAVGSNLMAGLAWEKEPPLAAAAFTYLGVAGLKYLSERRARQRVTGLFGRYVDEKVVHQLLASEAEVRLGGERRPVTVMFMDIVGFTPMSERLPPEEVVGRLNDLFTRASDVIFRNEGTLDKFMGDAIMAIWNAPLPVADHPYKAVQAALEIVGMAGSLEGISFRIGINTGDAIVGNIGAARRLEYTAIGDTVNLAARLESIGQPGTVTLSERTYEALGGRIPAIPLGEVNVKGKAEAVKVFRIVPGEAAAASGD